MKKRQDAPLLSTSRLRKRRRSRATQQCLAVGGSGMLQAREGGEASGEDA